MVYGISALGNQQLKNACLINPNSNKTDCYTDVFTQAKNAQTQNQPDKKAIENNNKYWEAAMNIVNQTKPLYEIVESITNLELQQKARVIADSFNDFCNSMTAGKLAQAKNSSNIDDEIKKCVEEAKAKQEECLQELKQLYEQENSEDKTEANNPFAKNNYNLFS